MASSFLSFRADGRGVAGIEYAIMAAILSVLISSAFSAARLASASPSSKLESAFVQERFELPAFERR